MIHRAKSKPIAFLTIIQCKNIFTFITRSLKCTVESIVKLLNVFSSSSRLTLVLGPEVPVPLNERHGPGDHPGVVAKEEATHGGEEDGEVEERRVPGGGGHPRLWGKTVYTKLKWASN